ncbi:ATP-binding cassette domain-containing protein [bacterium]|nr:ATP-binding cassette domain-containing protein [bacterium]
MIEVQGLKKNYGSFTALKGIDFTINKGQIVGFLGPNGAGKTTTMKILSCFMYPTSGEVKIDSKNILSKPDEIRRLIGYLPEHNPLYEEMIVYSYLSFVCDMRGIPKSKKADAISRVISITGLSEMADKTINVLSKGYRQRVGLAQAMIHDPMVLILDEPTSGLDPNQIVEIRNVLKEIGKEKTVILSTHILSEVEHTCERAIIIDNGKIVTDENIDVLKKGFSDTDHIDVVIKGIESKDYVEKLFSNCGSLQDIVIENSICSFKVITDDSSDNREKIFGTVVKNDLVLLELHAKPRSLEKLFQQLTYEDKADIK